MRTEADVLRIGIIGAGYITRRIHLPLWQELEDTTVVGICDVDIRKAELTAAEHSVPLACQTAEQLFEEAPDAVIIATPNSTHVPLASAALRAGIHVICEKPVAVSPQDAFNLSQLAQANHRHFLVCYTNRFRPECRRLREIIGRGELGSIYHVRAGWLRHMGIPQQGAWFTSRQKSGGGAVADIGSHLLDLFVWLLGLRPQCMSVYAAVHNRLVSAGKHSTVSHNGAETGSETGSGEDVEDFGVVLVVINDEVSLSLEVAWADLSCAADTTYVHVLGDRGGARLETLFGLSPAGERPSNPLMIYPLHSRAPTRIHIDGAADPLACYRQQTEEFARILRRNTPRVDMTVDGLWTALMLDAIYQSATTGVTIEVSLKDSLVLTSPDMAWKAGDRRRGAR